MFSHQTECPCHSKIHVFKVQFQLVAFFDGDLRMLLDYGDGIHMNESNADQLIWKCGIVIHAVQKGEGKMQHARICLGYRLNSRPIWATQHKK